VTEDREAETERRARFERLYLASHDAISAYVVRRVPESVDPADVVADVFAVAWRRIDDVPPPPEDRLWLFGAARRCVSQASRSRSRRERLLTRVSALASRSQQADAESEVDLRIQVAQAIRQLPLGEAEALRLVAWEQLTHEQAAKVLGCSSNAVAVRVHRARGRLRQLLSDQLDPPSEQDRIAEGVPNGP
jgi:RNA polymerase sigma factor (sigma-70 family)